MQLRKFAPATGAIFFIPAGRDEAGRKLRARPHRAPRADAIPPPRAGHLELPATSLRGASGGSGEAALVCFPPLRSATCNGAGLDLVAGDGNTDEES